MRSLRAYSFRHPRLPLGLHGAIPHPPRKDMIATRTPMRNAIVLTMVLGACTFSLSAQKSEAFDVVSIRQSRSGERGGGSLMLPGGRYSASNIPVIVLLDAAYGIPPERVVGGPAWIRSDRYNIEARADE